MNFATIDDLTLIVDSTGMGYNFIIERDGVAEFFHYPAMDGPLSRCTEPIPAQYVDLFVAKLIELDQEVHRLRNELSWEQTKNNGYD